MQEEKMVLIQSSVGDWYITFDRLNHFRAGEIIKQIKGTTELIYELYKRYYEETMKGRANPAEVLLFIEYRFWADPEEAYRVLPPEPITSEQPTPDYVINLD